MLLHPSLTSPYTGPPPLKAVAKMKPNEPCWCGQGMKWKKCHKGREDEEPFNVFNVEDDARKRGRKGYCSHSLEGQGCSDKIISSHTVQRAGGLAAIAEGKSRVLTVKPNLRSLMDHDGHPPPTQVGMGKASVFPGFCEAHDDTLFKAIEGDDVEFTADEALLFAYRAIAYERFTKAVQVANARIQRMMDCGQPLAMQEAIQQHFHLLEVGARRGLAETERQLGDFRIRVEGQDTAGLHYRAYRFDRVLPVVGCGGFMPEIAIDGTHLQRLGRGTAAVEHLTLTITSYSGKSVAIFAWIGPQRGPSGRYLDAFDSIDSDAKADALIQIAFEQLENIFLRKSWWEELPDEQREDLTQRIQSGIGLNMRSPGYYARGEPLLFEADTVESRGG